MPEYISSIQLPNGNSYEIKDSVARAYHEPIETKTYTDVIATANDANGAGFFYLRVRGDTYNTKWTIKTRVFATVPSNELYETDSTFEIWGYANTYGGYRCVNRIKSTSYLPIYYNSLFFASKTGYDNGCSNWVGFNLISSHNNTDASYKRNITIELLDYQNCTVEFQDNLITPTNIPDRAAHTNYYTSTNTSYTNFSAYQQGFKHTGDANDNTTTISNLVYGNGAHVADSVIYRYQLLFKIDKNTLTPLNNNNNNTKLTKTLLTNVEFLPFENIFYYGTTTTIAANANIGGGSLYYQYSGINLQYTFNINTTDLTAHQMVYLKLIPVGNDKAKLASADPLTQTLPESEDGYWYLSLGRAYSGYQLAFYHDHPVYAYKNGKLVTVKPTNMQTTDIYVDNINDIALNNYALKSDFSAITNTEIDTIIAT